MRFGVDGRIMTSMDRDSTWFRRIAPRPLLPSAVARFVLLVAVGVGMAMPWTKVIPHGGSRLTEMNAFTAAEASWLGVGGLVFFFFCVLILLGLILLQAINGAARFTMALEAGWAGLLVGVLPEISTGGVFSAAVYAEPLYGVYVSQIAGALLILIALAHLLFGPWAQPDAEPKKGPRARRATRRSGSWQTVIVVLSVAWCLLGLVAAVWGTSERLRTIDRRDHQEQARVAHVPEAPLR